MPTIGEAVTTRRAHLMSRWPGWWRLAVSGRRWIVVGAITVTVVWLIALLVHQWQEAASVVVQQSLQSQQRQHELMTQQAAAASSAAALAPSAWWTLLPALSVAERSTTEQLSIDALALAPKLGVEVGRLTFAPQPQANGAPYRSTAMQVELRGPYADVKRWLGELLARRPHSLALKSLDVRRVGEGAAQSGVTASAELRLYERVASTSP